MFPNYVIIMLLMTIWVLGSANIVEESCLLLENCVEVGGKPFYNVTEGWHPRIGSVAGWLAVVIPTVYAAGALLVMVLVGRNKKYRDRNAVDGSGSMLQQGVEQVKDWYEALVFKIYFPDYVGEDLYRWITNPQHDDTHFPLFNNKHRDTRYVVWWKGDGILVADMEQYCRGLATWEEMRAAAVRVCDKVEGKKFSGMFVTANSLLYYRDYKPGFLKCKCVVVPNFVKVGIMVVTLVCIPIFALLWDIMDVFFDCFYFQQLEYGNLIDSNITRNVYVNNAILTFAILGALKSTLLAYGFYKMIRNSYDSEVIIGKFIKPIITCFKIFFEDGVEVILEYYFIEKFVSVTTNVQYLLIVKDVITACYYTLPIIFILKDSKKYYKEITSKDEYTRRTISFNGKTINISDYGHVYVSCVIVHLLFSMITVTRVIGSMFQYVTGDIAEECFVVTNGRLMQTPFTTGCLNPFDWVILVLYGLILTMLVAGVAALILFKLLIPLSKSASKCIGRNCNYVRFYMNGDRSTLKPRYLRVTEECVV